jgi:hypothetical protein
MRRPSRRRAMMMMSRPRGQMISRQARPMRKMIRESTWLPLLRVLCLRRAVGVWGSAGGFMGSRRG